MENLPEGRERIQSDITWRLLQDLQRILGAQQHSLNVLDVGPAGGGVVFKVAVKDLAADHCAAIQEYYASRLGEHAAQVSVLVQQVRAHIVIALDDLDEQNDIEDAPVNPDEQRAKGLLPFRALEEPWRRIGLRDCAPGVSGAEEDKEGPAEAELLHFISDVPIDSAEKKRDTSPFESAHRKNGLCGQGALFYSSIDSVEERIYDMEGLQYSVVLQSKVRPEAVRIVEGRIGHYIVNHPSQVRTVGICVKLLGL